MNSSKKGLIYVIGTQDSANNNEYIIGDCLSKDDLWSHLKIWNLGRSAYNFYNFYYIKYTVDRFRTLRRIKHIFKYFIDDNDYYNTIQIQFNLLKLYLDSLREFPNKSLNGESDMVYEDSCFDV